MKKEQKIEQLETTSLPTQMLETDVLQLQLAKSKRETALAEAKTAIANNEKAELNYKYIVLQLYFRYNLKATDSLTEEGVITRAPYDEQLKDLGGAKG